MPDSVQEERGVPFAQFERRAAAAMIDVAAVFFLSIWLMSTLTSLAAWSPTGRPVLGIVALLYFAGGWASPLSATLAQWAVRIRIVDESGERLGPGRAIVRAVLFIVGVVGILTIAQVPETPSLLLVAGVSMAAFYIAAITANRQGVHDLIVRSVAVKSSVLKSTDARAELQARIAQTAGSRWLLKRPSSARLALTSVLILVVVFGIYSAALVRYEMELRARISYAYVATSTLRNALEASYRATGKWEKSETVLGLPTKSDYPDGGYFVLEDEGVIRIRFTVIPKLKRISLVVSPSWDGESLTWNCRAEGEIASGVLPAHCRS